MGEYEGINLYGYVLNDPVRWTDPMGLCAAEGAAALGSGLAGLTAEEEAGWAIGGNFNPAVDLALGVSAIGVAGYVAYEYLHAPTMPTIWDARQSGKERADDIPSWAQGQKPLPGESGKDYADRLLKDKYGPGNYPTGPGSEQSKLKKYGDRGCK